jgi:hypothetical protein
VTIDPGSVSRDSPDLPGRVTEVIEQNIEASAGAKGQFSLNRTSVDGSLSAEAGARTTVSKSRKFELEGAVDFMIVTQSKTAEGDYRWSVEPRRSATLHGRPWDAVSKPRAQLVDKRKDRTKGIPPTVRVEVRCRREDLVIEELTVKDETRWQSIKSRTGFSNRMAAAESYIRDRLEEEGFEAADIQDAFGEITLGTATAQSGMER